jgi:hypothetical protein
LRTTRFLNEFAISNGRRGGATIVSLLVSVVISNDATSAE